MFKTQETNGKVWLFHRGEWTLITNPLNGRQMPDNSYRRQTLHEYTRPWWRLGPTFLHSDYAGLLIYTYAYNGTKNLPEYLIRVYGMGQNGAIYAQDFPDLLEVLNLLSPLVVVGIFTDMYRRSLGRG